ncbi:fibroleukin-like [Drosophila montana]|uniref:fibroleukin-like n=1 Tax=Drosophila montana TaxID=40370 RepID=UPI00313C2447
MQIWSVTAIILLTCSVLRAENSTDAVSSKSIAELLLQAQQYEDEIQQDEESIGVLEKYISENITNIKKDFDIIRNQLRQFEELENLAQIYRAALLKIEPTLCLPELKLSGSYKINGSFEASCSGDDIAGPGWTVIQRRIDNNLIFQQNGTSYERGFGDSSNNFFIGLQKLYQLTSSKPHELYIRLENLLGETRYALYSHFKIADLDEHYTLKQLGDYAGNAGNALKHALDQPFRIYDTMCGWYQTNPNIGWWIGCNLSGEESNLNALLSQWHTWPTSFRSVEMMIRPQLMCHNAFDNKKKYSNSILDCLFKRNF